VRGGGTNSAEKQTTEWRPETNRRWPSLQIRGRDTDPWEVDVKLSDHVISSLTLFKGRMKVFATIFSHRRDLEAKKEWQHAERKNL